MDLLASEQQLEIVSSARRFLSANLPTSRTRAMIDEPSNLDVEAWGAVAELGWFGLGLPEFAGGVGCGLADEALLFREIGRSVASGPFLSTVLGVRVAALGGRPDLASEIMGGAPVGLVVLDRGARVDEGSVGGDLLLLDAVDAGFQLLALPDRAMLLLTDDLEAGSSVPCIDPTTRLRRFRADGVSPVVSLAADVDPVERRGLVLVAAMETGIAEATRDIAAQHAASRVQFDRPIGVNQAVKHPCADMAVRAELAWAQSLVAALAIEEGRQDDAYQALAAAVVAGQAAEQNAGATIQVLGGMGFTFEHDANLYLKRAMVLNQAVGGRREALSRLIALPAAA